MKDLEFLLKRMSQTELATKLGMVRSNITIWKTNKKVPALRAIQLREIIKNTKGKLYEK